MTSLPLAGRTAFVTGSGSGIGAAIAARLAADGAMVTCVDVNSDAVNAVADRVGGIPLVLDLADTAAVAELTVDTDILVSNAGIQHVAPLHEFPVERFDFMMRLMLHTPFLLVRAALPAMYARGWGRVVHISSAHGLRASAFKSAYVMAKHGTEGLSKVTALEGAPHGVTSNCVNPGYVRTPLVQQQIADQARAHGLPEDEVLDKIILARSAIKRMLEPEEVANAVAYVVGPGSDLMTGASLSLDGGWTAQ
ncbi:3-hydroxybutyrate dehydrogenase [Nakamurella panacisegetis]|uniref:3-hydroxybutyrate dehydrogenase n=1 Tax=Nakamurella panacisegetis TaxID=1090615 RepID=A0A1H0NCR9_9ACTN|nr:3-hydroxybutyrate dehydrogenase [Nakamurella panacisegetis]SDO90441.1 3-hydroxybutyrate dehydrogenase [Nakamurella panacisegetis]